MKKIILLILICLTGYLVYAQENKLTLGTIDSIQSKILNEQRKIWIYVPSSASNTTFAKQKYPVLYLLDGEAHFYSVAGMIQQLSEVNGNTFCPEMIVVAITNTNRTRDLTPTHVEADPALKNEAFY